MSGYLDNIRWNLIRAVTISYFSAHVKKDIPAVDLEVLESLLDSEHVLRAAQSKAGGRAGQSFHSL